MVSVHCSLRRRAFNWDRRLGLGLASVLKRVCSDAVIQYSKKKVPLMNWRRKLSEDWKTPMPDPVEEKLRELRNSNT